MNIILRRSPTRTLAALAPFYRQISLLDEIEELARGFWGSWQPFIAGASLTPHIEMYEEKDELVIKTELPGINKEDLDITLDGDVLTIKAEKKQEEVAEEATYHARERYYGQYLRSTSLPFYVDGDNISATLEDGLLKLRLPKAEQVKTKKIEVKAQITKGEGKKRERKPRKKAS